MYIATNLLIITVSALVLIKAIDVFISSATNLAQHLNISGYTISFLLVAVGTSLPEIVVSITSAMEGKSALAYGNAMGSNITLITLIIAIPILLGTSIATRSVLHSKDAYYATFFAFLPIMLSIDGKINRTDGVVLLIAYIVYVTSVMRRSRGIEKIVQQFEPSNAWKEGVLFALSLAGLLLASRGIVFAALNISSSLGWALSFVGLTITALGTSLPEIAFVLSSNSKDNQREILGDIVGSVAANSTVVMGIASIIYPIELAHPSLGSSTIFFLFISILLFLKFTISRERLEKFEAFILLIIYIAFVATEYYIQTQIG